MLCSFFFFFQGYNELRVDMEFQGNSYYAHYTNFSVGDELSKYRLSVDGYNGTAGDSLIDQHDGMMFSTLDQDNDLLGEAQCAVRHLGAWWYHGCYESNLNGRWGLHDAGGLICWGLKHLDSVSATEMKVRNVS